MTKAVEVRHMTPQLYAWLAAHSAWGAAGRNCWQCGELIPIGTAFLSRASNGRRRRYHRRCYDALYH